MQDKLSTYSILFQLLNTYKENKVLSPFTTYCFLGFVVKLLQITNFLLMILTILELIGGNNTTLDQFLPAEHAIILLCLLLILVNFIALIFVVIKNYFYVEFEDRFTISCGKVEVPNMRVNLANMKNFSKLLHAYMFIISSLIGMFYLIPQVAIIACLGLLMILVTGNIMTNTPRKKIIDKRKRIFEFLYPKKKNMTIMNDMKSDMMMSIDSFVASLLFAFGILVIGILDISFNNIKSTLIIIVCVRYFIAYSIDATRTIRKLRRT